LEERCSEVEQLAGMVAQAQQQLQGHVGRWSQLLAALGDTHGGVAAAASCHRADGSTPGSPVHAQQDPWQQRVQTGDGEEGEGQLLLLPGSLGSSLARSSGALSLVLQELGEAPAGCLAGEMGGRGRGARREAQGGQGWVVGPEATEAQELLG
jgi:hypothetical protein